MRIVSLVSLSCLLEKGKRAVKGEKKTDWNDNVNNWINYLSSKNSRGMTVYEFLITVIQLASL